jgi:predicted flap endonuclease-1-like 5' DNA nuclease
MFFLIAATVLLAEGTEPVGVPGWIPVVIGVILLLLFWWGLTRNSIPQGEMQSTDDHHEDEQASQEPHGGHSEEIAETAVPVLSKAVTIPLDTPPATPDDLKKIEGIGPKIEGILHDAGVLTFAQLAAATVSSLEKIVREDAGIRIAFPDTWPEQAALAASDSWAALEKLQDELKGGRRA